MPEVGQMTPNICEKCRKLDRWLQTAVKTAKSWTDGPKQPRKLPKVGQTAPNSRENCRKLDGRVQTAVKENEIPNHLNKFSMLISNLNLSSQLLDESYRFHKTFYTLMGEYNLSALLLQALHTTYGAAIQNLDIAIKKIPQTTFTERIFNADVLRDETYSGILGAVNLNLRHYRPEIREASSELKVVLKTFGNPTRKSQEKETSILENLCQELDSPKYAPLVATCGLTSWVERLKEQNNLVIQLFAERRDDKATQTELEAKACRKEVENEYRRIKRYIEVLADMNGVDAYAELIRKHNLDIARFGTLIAQRIGKGGEAAAAAAGGAEDDEQ